MTLIIRNAVVGDFDNVALLAVEAYCQYSRFLTIENWNTMQKNLSNVSAIAQQGQSIVARCKGELVGSVVYFSPGTSNSRLFQPEWASIRMLAVSPRYQRQGIGQKLSKECIERARIDRAEVIALHTSELMTGARRMYEKLGFETDVELPRSLGIRYWRYLLKLSESTI